MRTIRDILFIAVALIVFLHALLAHGHHGEMTCQEHSIAHQNANGIVGYLSLAFHQDSNSIFGECIFAGLEGIDGSAAPADADPIHGRAVCANRSMYLRTPFQQLFGALILSNGLRAPPECDSCT